LATAQSVEQQLKKLELQWFDAEVKRDFAALDRIMADDYTVTDPAGVVIAKAEEMASLKLGEDVVVSMALSDMKVRVYGDTAVVPYVGAQKESGWQKRRLSLETDAPRR